MGVCERVPALSLEDAEDVEQSCGGYQWSLGSV